MPKPADESMLLCETCGYDITGLEPDRPCSECGRIVASSLPTARRGSPFQRRRTLRALVATAWSTLGHPIETYRTISIEPRTSRLLLRLYILIAAVLLSPGPWTTFARVLQRQPALAWAINMALGAVALWLLTRIEMYGIRTFGARRGWRITPTVALAICAHAAIGWVVTGVLFLASLVIPLPVISFSLPKSFGSGGVDLTAILAPTGALFVGMCIFEVLVYLGVRQCPYANRADVVLGDTKPVAPVAPSNPRPPGSPA